MTFQTPFRMASLRRLLPFVLPLGLALGAGGCHTYKYVDVTVAFDPAMDDADILSIARCRILVTGADSDNFLLQKCPNHIAADPHAAGEFEFSTFADSGTLTFEFKAFNGLNDTPNCQIVEGKVDVPLTAMTTIPAMLTGSKGALTGCSTVTPVNDGSP